MATWQEVAEFLTDFEAAMALGFLAGRLSVEQPSHTFTFPECRVRRVVDGDTIIVQYAFAGMETTEGVRLLNIDPPERGEPQYDEATGALQSLVAGKTVTLEFEEPGKVERDNFGRLLAYVFADGMNVNVEMVRQGWSEFYTKYGKGRYAEAFRAAEKEAQSGVRISD